MDLADPPAKRVRLTPPPTDRTQLDTSADFVSFDLGEDDVGQVPANAPTGPRQTSDQAHRARHDPRNRFDKPKSKHVLFGEDEWVLVKTKLGRRFVHNLRTRQSLWRIPRQLQQAVDAFELEEEKQKNLEWSEQQLKMMRPKALPSQNYEATNQDVRQRRRSESLQREDEAAMMAELAAQAEHAEEQDAKQAAQAVSHLEPRGYLGEASDSEYEYVEVTDTEGEGSDAEEEEAPPEEEAAPENSGPVDFGEDDIAYQLAMMGQEYGLDPEEYEMNDEEDYGAEEEGMAPTEDEAVAIFHEMLDSNGISPFTPWDKLIADESPSSIVFDERYTVLRSGKARKDAWDDWSRDRAAKIKAQRAMEEKKDPRVTYLVFLRDHATTKLYWPEFKRKFKREALMNDRALQEKDREKYYRELVAKMKLPESKRKDEIRSLLKPAPRGPLSDKLAASVVLYSLPTQDVQDMLKSAGVDTPTGWTVSSL